MNQRSASFLAVAFCAGVILVVALFGYAKYRKGQMEDADFRRALRAAEQRQSADLLQARMPTQLPPRATSVLAGETPQPPGAPAKP